MAGSKTTKKGVTKVKATKATARMSTGGRAPPKPSAKAPPKAKPVVDLRAQVVDDPKYTDRPGPPYHAKGFPGEFKVGNDGLEYVSVANIKNVYTWRKVKPEKPE
jgi:hypothetical protein